MKTKQLIGLCLVLFFYMHVKAYAGSVKKPDGDAEKERVIILFPEKSVMHYDGGVANLKATAANPNKSQKYSVQNEAVRDYRAWLDKQSAWHVVKIEQAMARQLKILHSYDLSIFGIATELTSNEFNQVKQLLSYQVFLDQKQEVDDFRSAGFIGAPRVWSSWINSDSTNAGSGVVVGVMDTGINSRHPSFGALSPVCSGGFIGPLMKIISQSDCTQMLCRGGSVEDVNGHGSHVASIAVGNVVSSLIIPGVEHGHTSVSGIAPCARLRSYKVCTPQGSCWESNLLAAIQASIEDQIDVINLSRTSVQPWDYGGSERSFLDAMHAGIVISTSAGNLGNIATLTSSPRGMVNHRAPWVLSVAATSHDRVAVMPGRLQVAGESQSVQLLPSDSPIQLPSGPVLLKHFEEDPGLCLGRLPERFFQDSFALVTITGGCSRIYAARAAYERGAQAVIYFDARSAGRRVGTERLYLNGAIAPVPLYSVPRAEGIRLSELTRRTNPVRLNFDPPTRRGDVLTDFSLRGPNLDFDVTKPDLAAPGLQIYGAYISTGSDYSVRFGDYAFLSGTSMSAPQVAGAAALLKQIYPDFSPMELMSALRMTAVSDGFQEDGITRWTPDDVGSGRVDVASAAQAGLVMDESYSRLVAADPRQGGQPSTLNLPDVRNTRCGETCSWERTVRSAQRHQTSWIVQVVQPPNARITVTPNRFSLTPRGTEGDTQQLSIQAEIAPSSSGFPRIEFGEIRLIPVTSPVPVSISKLTVAVREGPNR